jgi:hypothetical protein
MVHAKWVFLIIPVVFHQAAFYYRKNLSDTSAFRQMNLSGYFYCFNIAASYPNLDAKLGTFIKGNT